MPRKQKSYPSDPAIAQMSYADYKKHFKGFVVRGSKLWQYYAKGVPIEFARNELRELRLKNHIYMPRSWNWELIQVQLASDVMASCDCMLEGRMLDSDREKLQNIRAAFATLKTNTLGDGIAVREMTPEEVAAWQMEKGKRKRGRPKKAVDLLGM